LLARVPGRLAGIVAIDIRHRDVRQGALVQHRLNPIHMRLIDRGHVPDQRRDGALLGGALPSQIVLVQSLNCCNESCRDIREPRR
jgi:hypothetical protein